jgi:hypothetical protein
VEQKSGAEEWSRRVEQKSESGESMHIYQYRTYPRPRISLAGNRLSEQPTYMNFGVCFIDSFSKYSGWCCEAIARQRVRREAIVKKFVRP